MTDRIKEIWHSDESIRKAQFIISLILVLCSLTILGLVAWFSVNQSRRLETLQVGTTQIGFQSRQQNRCTAWEAQATLRSIVLASPGLTPDQIAKIKDLIPLPSLRVRNGDGTVVILDCDKVVRQAVPGLPQGIVPHASP